MSMTRRQFLTIMGGTGLVYAFRFVPGAGKHLTQYESLPIDLDDENCLAIISDIDYEDWIVFDQEGKVTIFTGRTELGQGLKTVLTAIVTQGLDISSSKLTVIQGDTVRCPDDGPTTGSCSTRQVGWGFWLACEQIRIDLLNRAVESRGLPREELQFSGGGVGLKSSLGTIINAFELGSGEMVMMTIDPSATSSSTRQYVDLGIPNVNAKKIVTGTLKYASDMYMPGMLYADWLTPPYHRRQTRLQTANLNAARALPGIKMVEVVREDVAAVGERYSDVVKALDAVEAKWSTPRRSKEFNVEEEIRATARFVELKEKQGNVDAGLAESYLTVSETYITHFTTQAPIETDTALVRLENGGYKATAWVSSQHPHRAREIIAKSLHVPESDVRVIGMPVGGGFGGKTSNPVTGEAAELARLAGAPVKLLYSRKNQFQWRARYKMACVIDLTTGIGSDGRMLARKIDTYQDVGSGTTDTYEIPNVLTRNFQSRLPVERAISRGTSYVQNCFATESHIDMVAAAVGIDPFEFRRNNVKKPAFIPLIDACAEMIDYYNYQPEADQGKGLAITNHGGNQMGAIGAEVAVNRKTGKIMVKRICGAFDIGTIINHKTTTVGIRGAISWGIGYILSEEIKLDGHSAETAYLSEYRIPRFSDIPPIEIVFLDNYGPGSPRGCGELPVIPTIGAIANAVYDAIGVRFYSTPITPSRVLEAL